MTPDYLQIAQTYAEQYRHEPWTMPQRHIALLFHGRKLLSIGRNIRKKNYRGQSRSDISIHAERNAVLKTPRGIPSEELTLVTFRIMGDGSLGNGKPCKSCESFLKKRGIGIVLYSGGV